MLSKTKIGTAIIILFFFAASCHPKMETCCHNVRSDRPVLIGFIGYDSTELSKSIMYAYSPEDNLKTPEDSVLGSQTTFNFYHDTAFAAFGTGKQFFVNANVDYKIILSSPADVHTFTGQNNPAETECVEMEEHCSPGSSQAIIVSVKNIHLDGVLTLPVGNPLFSVQPVIYIKK